MKYICLDLENETDIAEVHEIFKTMLDFPDYYGDNYNALYDELTSVSDDIEINLIVKEEDLDKWETLRRVLSEAAGENAHIVLRGKIM